MPRVLQITLFALSLVGVACAGGDPSALDGVEAESSPGGDGVITMTADDTLQYSTDTLTAPAGEVGFELACGDAVEHNIVIEGRNDDEPVAVCAAGEVGEVGTIVLDPGTYTYYCGIPGHRITMNGELTVVG